MSYPPKTYVIGDGLKVEPPAKVEKDIIAAILKVRRAAVCVVCGNQKESGRWFDRTCYFTLRPELRPSFWQIHQRSDSELRDTFLQAVDHLIKHGKRFVPRQKMSVEAQQIIEETGFSEALTEYLFESRGGRA